MSNPNRTSKSDTAAARIDPAPIDIPERVLRLVEQTRQQRALTLDVPLEHITAGPGDLDPWDSPEVIAPTGAIPAAIEQLHGAGILTTPGALGLTTECGAPDYLRQIMEPALGEDLPWCCIECGAETAPGSTVCSASCGYALTGDYPPAYEKDYGDA